MTRHRLIALLVLGLALLAGQAALSQNQNSDPRGYVENLISDLVSSDGQKVDVFGLSVSLTGNVQAERITVSDIEGAWLEIEGLGLDWDPFSLLGDVLTINSLDVTEITVQRWPKQPPTESTAETQAPKPVAINRVQVNRITLAETIAGEPTQLTAGGTVNITANPVRIAIDTRIERTDDIAGEFAAKIDYQPQSTELLVDIRGSDGPSGLIGNLLKIPGKPNLDLAIFGSGKLDAWNGTVSLKTGPDQALSGDIRIASVDSGRRVGVGLEGSVAPFMPVSLAPAFQGRAVLAGSVLIPDTDRPVAVETFFLETGAIKLDVSGTIDPATDGTALSVSVRTPAETIELVRLPDGPVTTAGLQLDASLTGRMDNPQWTFSGHSRQISLGSETVTDLRLTGASKAAGNGISGFAANLSTDLASNRKASWMASLRGPVKAAVTGTYGTGQPFTIRSAELSLAAGQMALSGLLQPFEELFDIQADIQMSQLATGNKALDRLLASPTNLVGTIARASAKAPVSLSDLQLSTPALSVTLNGTFDENRIALETAGQFRDLARLVEDASGEIAFQANLSGRIDSPDLSLKAGGRNVNLSGKPFENAVLEFNGRLDPQVPKGVFSLTGRYGGLPASAGFSLQSENDGTRSLTDLKAMIAGAELTGDLQWPADNRPSGTLDFIAPDLSGIGNFLLIKAEGALNGKVRIQPNGSTSRITLRASGSDLHIENAIIGTLDADVTIADIAQPLMMTGKIGLTQAHRGQVAFDELTIDADLRDGDYALVLAASGDTINGTASTVLKRQAGDWLVTLANADMNLYKIPLRLTAPAEITIRPGTTLIGPARLSIGSGTLNAEGVYGEKTDVRLDASAVPLSIANAFASGLGLTGSLTGSATVRGQPEAPDIQFDATISQASSRALQQAGLKPVNIRTQGVFADNTLTLESTASGAGDLQMTAKGKVRFKGTPDLDLRINGALPLALFADELAQNGVRASGKATADLKISGPMTKPKFAGTAALADATIGDADGRFIVRNVAAKFQLSNDRIELTGLTGSAPGGGSVSATGQAGFAAESPIAANVVIRNGRYVDGTLVVSTFNADLQIGGSRSAGVVVGGEIVLRSTNVTLDSLPPAAQQLADVKHRRPPVPVARQWALLQDRKHRSGGGTTRLDLTIRTGNPIQVRGRGIDADFGGRLKIAGTTDNVEPVGRFTLLRGTLTIVGRQLAFDRGTLDFAGNLSPEIDIAATATTADASVTLSISGTAEKPAVIISSVPELPPEEALASLVFQQSTADLSPIQIARLADAVLVLSGGTRSGLFDGLRRTIGIDRLDVTTDSEGKTSVGAGRYINEKAYLGIEQGVEEGTTKVTIDLDITRTLKLRAGAGSGGETEAGFVFEKEY